MSDELLGYEMSGRRLSRENVQHLLTILDAAATWHPNAEDGLFARVVLLGVKCERWGDVDVVDAPSRETSRDFLHISLGVAAVHAEGVQLHQLAGVVLVHADAAAFDRPYQQCVAKRRM